jgi:hypothetical protein
MTTATAPTASLFDADTFAAAFDFTAEAASPVWYRQDGDFTWIYVTVPVTVAGTTKDVEFRTILPRDGRKLNMLTSAACFTGTIGRGAKTHKVTASLWQFDTEAAARKCGYRKAGLSGGADTLFELDGKFYGLKLEGMSLNRQVRINGWHADTPATSRHIMEAHGH